MSEKEYFSKLYEIASHLNKEFSLHSALRKALEKTVELLDLETGWIWLAEKDLKSVYLAASFNLPPALKDHPERLSGWCYCIQKYLSGQIDEATNISEISCSRLKDIPLGKLDLKFHATIPIITNDQKVGLINLLTKEKQQFDEAQLSLLNTVSELIGIAIQRTRLQETYVPQQQVAPNQVYEVLERVIAPRLEQIQIMLSKSESQFKSGDITRAVTGLDEGVKKVDELRKQVGLLLKESETERKESEVNDFHYPASPLTARELEVLTLVKSGRTNSQIAERLHIAERTVKFHVTSILSKLYAKTRTEAVDIALNRGLIGS